MSCQAKLCCSLSLCSRMKHTAIFCKDAVMCSAPKGSTPRQCVLAVPNVAMRFRVSPRMSQCVQELYDDILHSERVLQEPSRAKMYPSMSRSCFGSRLSLSLPRDMVSPSWPAKSTLATARRSCVVVPGCGVPCVAALPRHTAKSTYHRQ